MEMSVEPSRNKDSDYVPELTKLLAGLSTGQSTDGKLSTMMKKGEHSAQIWAGVSQLEDDQQKALLSNKGNLELRLYNQLLLTLANPRKDLRQELLAKLVSREPAFFRQQFACDERLREQFLLSLTDCHYHRDFKKLLRFMASTPSLANDFQNLMLDSEEQNKKRRALRNFLVLQSKKNDAICLTVLKHPEHFSTNFLGKMIFTRKGSLEKYHYKSKSALWRFNNRIKAILLRILPEILADALITVPPVNAEIAKFIDEHQRSEAFNTVQTPVKIPQKFQEFRRNQAEQSSATTGSINLDMTGINKAKHSSTTTGSVNLEMTGINKAEQSSATTCSVNLEMTGINRTEQNSATISSVNLEMTGINKVEQHSAMISSVDLEMTGAGDITPASFMLNIVHPTDSAPGSPGSDESPILSDPKDDQELLFGDSEDELLNCSFGK